MWNITFENSEETLFYNAEGKFLDVYIKNIKYMIDSSLQNIESFTLQVYAIIRII